MMRRAALFILCALMVAGGAEAALDRSLFPQQRPVRRHTYRPVLLPVFGPDADTPRPRPRPAVFAATPLAVTRVRGAVKPTSWRSLYPRPRPALKPRKAMLVRTRPAGVATAKSGPICGSRSIRGQTLSRIAGSLPGCGVSHPVRVSSVDGVALSPAATMDCDTARALDRWVSKGVKPTVKRLGGGVKSLQVIASYSCRTRNSKPGAKISEHGHGKAVDIAAINLNNGTTLSVLHDWKKGAKGKLLRRLHDSACGPFGTVLGPNSDRYHRNHFHLDSASYRSGPYCR